MVLGLAAAALVVALLVTAMVRVIGGSSREAAPGPPGPSASATVPGRAAFYFRIHTDPPAVSGKRAAGVSGDVAIAIAGRLSTFYDTVFLDPVTWAHGVPDDAWQIFAPSAADRARGDADALTLSDRATGLTSLKVTSSSLAVRVLLDPHGEPTSAIAEADFEASGTLRDGSSIEVTNSATYIFEVDGGQWLVVGYPNAATDVQGAGATP